MKTYILNSRREPVPCDDLIEFATFFWTEGNRRVAETEIAGVRISTVFLGYDHGFPGDRRPVLFETMVFTDDGEPRCERSCTWDDAAEVHARVVESVKRGAAEALRSLHQSFADQRRT